jgi:hypothetical protein
MFKDFSELSIMKIRYAGFRVSCAPERGIFIGTSQGCTCRWSTFFTKHVTWSTTATPTNECWDERHVTWGNRLYWPNYLLDAGLGVKRKRGTRSSSPLCIHHQVISTHFKNVYSYRWYECILDGEIFLKVVWPFRSKPISDRCFSRHRSLECRTRIALSVE